MKGVASGLLRSALGATRHVARATTKVAGEGAKEGLKNAVKNLTKEHVLKLGRQSLFGSSMAAPSSSGGISQVYHPLQIARAYAQVGYQFPASCECDYYAGAPVSASGKKILTCYSCAPRGMGARNYQRALDVTGLFPEGPRARAKPSHLKNYVLGNVTRKSRSRSESRGSTRLPKSRQRAKSR